MPFISNAEYRRLKRDRDRSERDRQAANTEVVRLTGAVREAQAEVEAMHHFLDYDLPAEVARPALRIWQLKGKIRELGADRAHWRSKAQVAERALGNQMAIALSADGIREGRMPADLDGEDTLTMPRPGPLLPPHEVVRRASSAWATQRDIATLQQALGGVA